MTEEKQRFYITFGVAGLRECWVEVLAYSEDQAREFARETYGKVWSGIYRQDEWVPTYFPYGRVGLVPL